MAMNLQTYPTGEDVFQALSLTLIDGEIRLENWPMGAAQVQQCVEECTKMCSLLWPENLEKIIWREVQTSLLQTVDESLLIDKMRVRTFERRLVLTCTSYIGLVPVTAQPDDVVCILLGGQAPFIL